MMGEPLKVFFFCGFVISLWASVCSAQLTRPLVSEDPALFELGVGAIVARFPDYPGSEESRTWVLPFPGFIYRGQFFRIDEEGGARGQIVKQERYEFNLSFGGSLPTSSEGNRARTGMPSLPLLAELGPSVLLKIKNPSEDNASKLLLSLPLRLATSIDFADGVIPDLREEGVIFNPFLYYIHADLLAPKTIFFISYDARFATRKYNDFYYTVESQFATPERPAFRARAGYSGSGVFGALAYLYNPKLSLFAAVYWSHYSGTVNQNSPLLTAKNNISAFAGFTWWFYESETKASERARTQSELESYFQQWRQAAIQ